MVILNAILHSVVFVFRYYLFLFKLWVLLKIAYECGWMTQNEELLRPRMGLHEAENSCASGNVSVKLFLSKEL